MLSDINHHARVAAQRLFKSPATLMIFSVLYIVLLSVIYLFLTTREATLWQVTLTFALAIITFVLFFALQAMGVRYALSAGEARQSSGSLIGRGLRLCWRLMLVSVPVILCALLAYYAFGKIETRLMKNAPDAINHASDYDLYAARANTATSDVVGWRDGIMTTLRVLFFGALLPLISIHLWSAASALNMRGMFNRIKIAVAQAFKPASLIIYAFGAIFFVAVPYLLITTRTPVKTTWLELALLAARLIAAFAFIVFGWTWTQGALGSLFAAKVSDVEVSDSK